MALLIIHSDDNFKDKVTCAIAEKTNREVIGVSSIEEACGFIDLLDNFSFILCENQVDNCDSYQAIEEFINTTNSVKSDPLYFILGKGSGAGQANTVQLNETLSSEHIIKHLLSSIEYKEDHSEFSSIPVGLLRYLENYPCEMFIKLKKSEQTKYVKRFLKADPIEQGEISSLYERGVKFLYIESTHKEEFYHQLNQKICQLVEKVPEDFLTPAELENYAFHTIHNIGVSEQSLQIASHVVNDLEGQVKNSDGFKKNLVKLMSNAKGYKKLSTKCICLIGEMILRNLSWANTTTHLTPIVEAAFLHDMALTDSLAKIRSEEDIVALNITDEKEIHMIQNHAQFAHSKIGMFPQVSNETKKILIGHHGAHNGIGFSTDLSALTKLTATFIVAEELAHHIITSETEKVKMNAIINFILEKYNNQAVVVDALEAFKKAFN